jgi:hypothetical protein
MINVFMLENDRAGHFFFLFKVSGFYVYVTHLNSHGCLAHILNLSWFRCNL